eukprot:TRINITY_DN6281_c0_g1_i2.p1 TRINITY_DN6281_c0_g1~~TRINITY_DN6281_c0_g1_i2.p1  ORF type:complete len:228 (+),score=50.42 TRINITY_DN6281_c0_g1_i2:187-870(+)
MSTSADSEEEVDFLDILTSVPPPPMSHPIAFGAQREEDEVDYVRLQELGLGGGFPEPATPSRVSFSLGKQRDDDSGDYTTFMKRTELGLARTFSPKSRKEGGRSASLPPVPMTGKRQMANGDFVKQKELGLTWLQPARKRLLGKGKQTRLKTQREADGIDYVLSTTPLEFSEVLMMEPPKRVGKRPVISFGKQIVEIDYTKEIQQRTIALSHPLVSRSHPPPVSPTE